MEEFEKLVNGLEDETLKQIICLQLEGVEKSEIANRLGIHVRSVQRKTKMVETKWLESMND